MSDSDFLPYRQFKTPGYIACLIDGTISIYSDAGIKIKEFSTGLEIQFCAANQGPDEILIGSSDKRTVKVFRVKFNETEEHPELMVLEHEMFEKDSDVEITAFTQYNRLAKKYWVIGDNYGNITILDMEGEVFGRIYGKVGSVESIVKQGQQLMYSGKRKIAVFNVGTMEVTSTCGETASDIFKFTIDSPSAIVHVSLTNGDILTYDSRFSISNGPAFCKAVHRSFSRFPGNLARIKGGLILWSASSLVFFNTSFLEIDITNKPDYFTLPTKYSRSIKSIPTAEGNLVLLSGIDQIRLYQVFEPDFIPVPASSSVIDFGYIRVIAIVIIVICFVLWKSKNRKTQKDFEVEKLEKSLEELTKSMASTSQMSEELTSRFRNVEESTLNLGGFRNRMQDDSD